MEVSRVKLGAKKWPHLILKRRQEFFLEGNRFPVEAATKLGAYLKQSVSISGRGLEYERGIVTSR